MFISLCFCNWYFVCSSVDSKEGNERKIRWKNRFPKNLKQKRYGKNKNIFQCYTWGLTLVALLLGICRVIKWSTATTFTLLMEIFLWLILFTLSLIIILIASVVLEWLEKDNTQTGGVPRTAIFLGFVATVLAAILKH